MPCAVLRPPLQLMKAAMPIIVVYIAKLDGRKEVEARNMPGLKIIEMRKNMAILGFRVVLMTRNNAVWETAQKKARA